MVSGGSSTAPTCDNGTSFNIPRPGETKPDFTPFKAKSLKQTIVGSDLIVAWNRDSTTLPLLTYTFEIFEDENCSGPALVSVSKNKLKRDADTLDISALTPDSKVYYLRMTVEDILVNETDIVVPMGDNTVIDMYSKSHHTRDMNIIVDNHGMLQFNATKNSVYTFCVRTLNGAVIEQRNVNLTKGIQSLELMKNISAGAYMVTVSEVSGLSGKKVVVVNR